MNKTTFLAYLSDNSITCSTKDGKNYYLTEPIKLVPHKANISKQEINTLMSILLEPKIKVTIEKYDE